MIRLISGVVLAAAALAAILLLPVSALRIVAIGVSLVATNELLRIAGASNLHPSPILTYAFVVLMCWSVSRPPVLGEIILLAAFAMLLVDVLWRARTLADAGVGVAAGVYIGLPLGALVAVHGLAGRFAVLLLLATVVASDSAQYYSGRMFGRRLLAPKVSPKKTVEGALGGVVFGTIVMMVGGRFVLPAASLIALGVLGVVIVFLGICGDLFESRLKRIAGLKDSSALIPGHGGILDRIDALLFATPVFYLFLQQLT